MNADWKFIANYINRTLADKKGGLDTESIQSIEHYINCDEYEMAFEILFLEIITNKLAIEDKTEALNIGKQLKLDEESVFDINFWGRFEQYLKENIDAIS
jgi:hypothetical protein